MRGEQFAVVIILVMLIGSVAATLMWGFTLRYRRRELQHKERLAAVEKGAPLPELTDVDHRAPWTPRVYLLRGLMWLFSGIGLTLFLVSISATHRPRSIEDRAWDAQRLRSVGAPEEQALQVLNDTSPHERLPPGFALIGLAPIGVGLAYLISYRVERNSAR